MLKAASRRLLRRFDSLALRIWSRRLELARGAEAARLPGLVGKARPLRALVDGVIRAAALRQIPAPVSESRTSLPPRTDWTWRPDFVSPPRDGAAVAEAGSQVTPDLRLFHDAQVAEIGLGRPYADTGHPCLAADIYAFDGTYLSLAATLPAAALAGLERSHLFHLELDVGMESPAGLSARLNLRHGPNTEKIVRGFDLAHGEKFVEFDIAYTDFDPSRGTDIWIDMIFDGMRMNRIEIRDILVLRRRRADV
ncbi:MAG: DUF6478 family protein [Paracoccaceae bacterium]